MRRLAVLQLSLALLGLAYAGRASPPAAAKAKVKPTPFAFYASGFGTKLIGGDVPADSAKTFPAPSPQQPVTIPGLVTLELGRPLTRDNADVAKAVASSLKVTLIPSTTKVTVGNARVRIERGARTGIVSGFERVGVARTTANGEAQELPSPGDTLEIPGLASVTPHVVARSRNDIEVVGLRNQLVEGDLATVDLAVSRMKLGKSVIRR